MNNEIEISPFGNNLMYKKGYTKDFVLAVIKKNRLAGIKINTRSENIQNLDFLSEFDFIESLDIVGTNDFKFDFLNKLRLLKYLSVGISGKSEINLSNNEDLERLTILWRKNKIFGLERCKKITELCLVDYLEEDFESISSLTSLIDLKIKTSSIRNASGIESLIQLKSLLFGNCKKLSSIQKIAGLVNLTSLCFDMCPNVKDYYFIADLINLVNLQINDCKGISTISFVEKLASLEKLTLLGNTDVLDGNLVPAKNIREVLYKHRSHYNIKIENKEYESLVKKNLGKIKGK